MVEKIINYTYHLKGGEESAVETADPLLDRREPCVVFCKDGVTRMKVGDGTHLYSELPWTTGVTLDSTLLTPGAAADAKAVGDKLQLIEKSMANLEDIANEVSTCQKTVIVDNSKPSIIEVDTYYDYGKIENELSIQLAPEPEDGILHEYMFEFQALKTNIPLTITPAPRWVRPPAIMLGRRYQVSIVKGLGVIVGA